MQRERFEQKANESGREIVWKVERGKEAESEKEGMRRYILAGSNRSSG